MVDVLGRTTSTGRDIPMTITINRAVRLPVVMVHRRKSRTSRSAVRAGAGAGARSSGAAGRGGEVSAWSLITDS